MRTYYKDIHAFDSRNEYNLCMRGSDYSQIGIQIPVYAKLNKMGLEIYNLLEAELEPIPHDFLQKFCNRIATINSGCEFIVEKNDKTKTT